ncbi:MULTISPECIES: YcaO-like family protein [unclassified Chryseobacterium]|uniref:YcaO-like family protein n=1 Tax=unclassified Chryseobacterium TaxID=2593645 RepID=UPI000D39A055|nr:MULTISPECIES: YcaO-like family protein [unclassified Chryseobacterium]PTT68057.1 hypothetical protein DBR25_20585 [Chryseobacterium sp. HMWF001]PVV50516.1 hypothetical protein DD829_22045 [Chryseobacterium sp. HMWF035]
MINKYFGNYGFLNRPQIKIASNIYMPPGLLERAFYSDNLFVIGNNKPNIVGGGISFDEKSAYLSAVGEFVERYSSSFQLEKGLVFGSYDNLSNKYKCYSPEDILYFTKEQYQNENFKLRKLNNDTEVNWIESYNFFNNEKILLPFFMTNVENIKRDGLFHINTTTGTACHVTEDKTIFSGLLECIERDAFSKFWYLQKNRVYKKYSQKYILNFFKDNKDITKLYDNEKIKIITYDLGELSYCPTYVVVIYFKKKNKMYQSIGAASRINMEEALAKACIEAYQGIEYIEMVIAENLRTINGEEVKALNFTGIDSFRKHFALYNVYPELIQKVPLLLHTMSDDGYFEDLETDYKHHIKNFEKEELIEKGIDEIYVTRLTAPDVEQLGFEVLKVTTPKLNLLTGNFNYPYLGLFTEENLFIEMPHPFP